MRYASVGTMWKWLKNLRKRPPLTAEVWVQNAEQLPHWQIISQGWSPETAAGTRQMLLELVQSYLASDLIARRELHLKWANDKATLYPLSAMSAKPDRYRYVSGELPAYARELAALAPPVQTMAEGAGAGASNEQLVGRFGMLHVQMSFFSSILHAMRNYLGDDVTRTEADDWQSPLNEILSAFWENHYRGLLGLPTTLRGDTEDAFQVLLAFAELVSNGHPNPYAEWRKTAPALALRSN